MMIRLVEGIFHWLYIFNGMLLFVQQAKIEEGQELPAETGSKDKQDLGFSPQHVHASPDGARQADMLKRLLGYPRLLRLALGRPEHLPSLRSVAKHVCRQSSTYDAAMPVEKLLAQRNGPQSVQERPEIREPQD